MGFINSKARLKSNTRNDPRSASSLKARLKGETPCTERRKSSLRATAPHGCASGGRCQRLGFQLSLCATRQRKRNSVWERTLRLQTTACDRRHQCTSTSANVWPFAVKQVSTLYMWNIAANIWQWCASRGGYSVPVRLPTFDFGAT